MSQSHFFNTTQGTHACKISTDSAVPGASMIDPTIEPNSYSGCYIWSWCTGTDKGKDKGLTGLAGTDMVREVTGECKHCKAHKPLSVGHPKHSWWCPSCHFLQSSSFIHPFYWTSQQSFAHAPPKVKLGHVILLTSWGQQHLSTMTVQYSLILCLPCLLFKANLQTKMLPFLVMLSTCLPYLYQKGQGFRIHPWTQHLMLLWTYLPRFVSFIYDIFFVNMNELARIHSIKHLL